MGRVGTRWCRCPWGNGGTTTFQMVHYLSGRKLEVFTNSFPIAEHLLKHSSCRVMLPAGTIYREQSLILSPFENDGIGHFYARHMFMGAQGVSSLGIMDNNRGEITLMPANPSD